MRPFKHSKLYSLRGKCPNTKLFLVRIFLYQSEYRKIRTRNNSVLGHFSRSDIDIKITTKKLNLQSHITLISAVQLETKQIQKTQKEKLRIIIVWYEFQWNVQGSFAHSKLPTNHLECCLWVVCAKQTEKLKNDNKKRTTNQTLWQRKTHLSEKHKKVIIFI